ncbi:hypothetical protein [Hyphobacterium marinum]|uniref:Uncharacterized protein n=1 Tax=Hyphobacterium marinum TaxID=3116574 RepID=A0ABU7M1N6_9PROT|nr:hypothetical protein [Hyphobacterium sp. Y6023]MEE2567727.1 hypothetical protein [Hyphobacterium sp. Y6023]
MRIFATILAVAALFAVTISPSLQAQDTGRAGDQTLPMCRDAEAGEQCRTRDGDIRVRPAVRQDGGEVPLQSLTSDQIDRITATRAIGGRWECACTGGEGKCNPVVEAGSLSCFAPGTGGCTGTCGIGVTVDTTAVGTGQAQGSGG